jgi:hypothetical protein
MTDSRNAIDAENTDVARLRAELDALRVQNEALLGRVSQLEETTAGVAPPRERGQTWRWAGAIALLVLSFLLAPLAVLTLWARNTTLDTERYVATVGPLAAHPAVQGAVATAVVDQLFAAVDVQRTAQESLPERAAFLAAPLTRQLHEYSTAIVMRTMATPQFQVVWEGANRRAHRLVVGALTAQGDEALAVRNGQVVLDLQALTTQAREELRRQGVGLFDAVPSGMVRGQVVLFQSDALQDAQRAIGALQGAATVLPIALLLTLAGALWLAPDRRRVALWIGVSFAVIMVLLGLALAGARAAALGALDASVVDPAVAGVVYDTLVRSLRESVRAGLALSLVVAAGAALAGPSEPAVRLRRTLSAGLRGAGGRAAAAGWDAGPVATWIARHRGALRVATLALAGLALVWWDQPSAGTVLGLVAAALVLLALIEVLGQATAPAPGA